MFVLQSNLHVSELQFIVNFRVYKEHFIHAKYDRREFVTPGGTAHYESGRKDGFLWKRGKDDSQFKKRRFILNAEEGTLKYYVKPDVSISVISMPFKLWLLAITPG